jgi:hypothetical protein
MKNIPFLRKYAWMPVLMLSLIPLFALFVPGMPDTHDGRDHVARIANFYGSLTEGNLIPRWGGNLNWGYGHPVLMFLYPLPSYMASVFRMTGLSFIDSTKAVFIVSYAASMLAMYAFVRAAFGRRAGIVAAVFYGFAPYRFVDVYVRGAIGEHMAFVFPPLIMHALWRMSGRSNRNTDLFYLSVVTGLLILSHNALSLMFLPAVLLYVLYLLFFRTRDSAGFAADVTVGTVLGFALSAFFWIPALFEGKYTLRDIVTGGEILTRFVSPFSLVDSPWNYGGSAHFTKELGLAQWVAVIAVPFLFKYLDRGNRVFTAGVFTVLSVSLFLVTGYSAPVWDHVPLLGKFQFPWRFLSLSVFAASLISVSVIMALGRMKNISRKTLDIAALLLVGIAVFGTADMWRPSGYLGFPESFYTGVYPGTTDTGESSPIWSVRFMEHTAPEPLKIITGDAHYRVITKTSTLHEYEVVATEHSRLVENTLYFPGWRVLVDGTDTDVEFQDPSHRGLMTFIVPPGRHEVVVRFGRTKVREMSDTVSLAAIIILTGIAIGGFIWRKRN